ncbi:hypothetical protein AVEN_155323-1 [Araneus ventricosus]|uniref:SF3 helicase domain-containing protein n=1 Tax=Araneus ventricosus TaxID=182803 RepID=A0A4Y2WXG6_ARAVE|nr:hypothetical protein AVEN_155323-1 [Araneus ventricosus]
MDPYLVPIHHVEHAIKDSYVIYDLQGGIFYCKHGNWNNFARFFTRTHSCDRSFTLDLCLAVTHALIFDIDVKYKNTDGNVLNSLLGYLDNLLTVVLKPIFFPKILHFTCILAFRPNGGMHLHFPEMAIVHDDYIRLCEQLQPSFAFENDSFCCTLDILSNAFLAHCGKPNASHYDPFRVYFFNEQSSYVIFMRKPESFKSVKLLFKRQKDNMNSFFRKLLFFADFQDMAEQTREFMMPVIGSYPPLYKLVYNTLINTDEKETSTDTIVANFTYREKETQFVHKEKELLFNGGPSWLKAYNYFTYSALLISNLKTNNRALQRWLNRNRSKTPVENGIFRHVNTLLRQDNFAFAENPNPLKSILTYNDGYFFLPVFYALIGLLKLPSKDLIGYLRIMLNDTPLLNRLECIDDKLIDHISKDFSINTILFCGSNLDPKPECMKDKIQLVIRNMKNLILCASTGEQLIDILRRIQERHFPIVVINMQHSCKKPQRFVWNFVNECWQEVNNQSDVMNLINTIWSAIFLFLKKNETVNFKEITKSVNINHIVSTIVVETNIDRKDLEMDRHKWHLRVRTGIFDLLTGHVGGTVPEFYISDRRMGIHLKEWDELNARPDLIGAYRLLVDKSFFLQYLKALFEDMTEDVYDTLREKFNEHGGVLNPLTESMLQFYVHFCKYTSFEYDVMMYFLDVLSSLLIATNYARKFFVLKGNTRNGKSKFFQMLSRVFGGYSHTIRSVNLQTGNVGLQAQPELAFSMFSCRIVTVEEMSGKINENMVKEITGNSNVSFRNLYEQNQGGIPTAKIFASTNSIPACTATEAFKDRVVAIPFEAVFTPHPPKLTSEQVETGQYKLETNDSVVEDSHQGFFVLIYQHLVHNMNMEDGTIHYRKEPDCLIEYKDQFLIMTDIFSQFQQFMDIQIVPGCVTTLQDVRSSIRQFLKQTRNASWDENDILIRFDAEYNQLKQLESDVDSYCPLPEDEYDDAEDESSSLDPEDENTSTEPVSKRVKAEEKIVIYRNIQIKNLRKERK